MRIAVDAMGGDFAPLETVRGSIQAALEYGADIALVGDKTRISEILESEPAYGNVRSKLDVVHASEVIEMGEHPATAVRRKKDSSLVVAARLVKERECQAMVSAGNTGAAMASSFFAYGRIKGVDRPAIASPMPTLAGYSIIVDAGANADCKPQNLLQFAQMGSIYMNKIAGIGSPTVGLLNIGAEETKGNELSLGAYELLRECRLNFIGNIEGRDITEGRAEVIVCDGFVGNIVLKFAEGLSSGLFSLIKQEVQRRPAAKFGGLLMKPAFRAIRKTMDYSEYGGAPLLGLNGITIISHGSSGAKAIKNAIRVASAAVTSEVVRTIADSIIAEEEGNRN